jgi:DNA-binding winged helix-turn-helix (wHTH) protein
MSGPTRRAYQFGPFSLDVDRRLMLKNDRAVALTSKAFETLLALVENHSRIVEKDELLKRIWPDTVVEERNLAVNISTLRKVLGESPESHEYIVTIPGRGYQFVAPLREPDARPAFTKIAEVEDTLRTEKPAPARHPLTWRQARLGAGILAVLIAVFGLGR